MHLVFLAAALCVFPCLCVQFTAVPHPPVKPMMYASGVQSMFGF